MSASPVGVEQPITLEQILQSFAGYGRSPSTWLVGPEFERHLLQPNGLPLPFFGSPGIRTLLERFIARGWKPYFEGENPIACFRDGSNITLEPGSQFELSAAPDPTVTDVAKRALAFDNALAEVIGDDPIHPVALGFTPFSSVDDISWVPKGRYVVMREYLIQRGALAHHMMKGTAAVQCSYDYKNEEDCAQKMRLAVLLGPLTTALFANSPLTEGKPNGFQSYRGHIWTQTDPDRTGFPRAVFPFTFEKWVNYLLDVPMMFVRSGDTWIHARGRTFRSWLDDGGFGRPPSITDWDLHQTSVFPEVRVKKLIEVRGADCVPLPLALSFCALFQGLLYSTSNMSKALEFAERFVGTQRVEDLFAVACREGLQGHVSGRKLASWAEDLLDLAEAGLAQVQPTDLRWLKPLKQLVQRGETPATGLLRAWESSPGVDTVLRHCAYRGIPGQIEGILASEG